MNQSRIPFDALPWETLAEGARQKTTVGAGERVRLLELTPAFVEPGWCTTAHAGYVLEGHLELRFEERIERLAPGDGLLIEGGEWHKARALTARALLLLVEDA